MDCNLCGKNFTRKDNLGRHKRTVHQRQTSQIEEYPKETGDGKKRTYKTMRLSYVKTIGREKGTGVRVCTLVNDD